eukprot:TRINITY_DN8797_c0_g1_i2.p1 TRINITY_DN8797_c0_g1~~TRINITY_DN8797_c0_g1_i2.p1  ORF type:complete len:644 (+),score=150.18 TRINITY_DN8797_c0_g1_i2:726-2657(+)
MSYVVNATATIVKTAPSTSNSANIVTQYDYVNVTVNVDPHITVDSCTKTGSRAVCHLPLAIGLNNPTIQTRFTGDDPAQPPTVLSLTARRVNATASIVKTAPSTSNSANIVTQYDYVNVTVNIDEAITVGPNCTEDGSTAKCQVTALTVGTNKRAIETSFGGDNPALPPTVLAIQADRLDTTLEATSNQVTIHTGKQTFSSYTGHDHVAVACHPQCLPHCQLEPKMADSYNVTSDVPFHVSVVSTVDEPAIPIKYTINLTKVSTNLVGIQTDPPIDTLAFDPQRYDYTNVPVALNKFQVQATPQLHAVVTPTNQSLVVQDNTSSPTLRFNVRGADDLTNLTSYNVSFFSEYPTLATFDLDGAVELEPPFASNITSYTARYRFADQLKVTLSSKDTIVPDVKMYVIDNATGHAISGLNTTAHELIIPTNLTANVTLIIELYLPIKHVSAPRHRRPAVVYTVYATYSPYVEPNFKPQRIKVALGTFFGLLVLVAMALLFAYRKSRHGYRYDDHEQGQPLLPNSPRRVVSRPLEVMSVATTKGQLGPVQGLTTVTDTVMFLPIHHAWTEGKLAMCRTTCNARWHESERTSSIWSSSAIWTRLTTASARKRCGWAMPISLPLWPCNRSTATRTAIETSRLTTIRVSS